MTLGEDVWDGDCADEAEPDCDGLALGDRDAVTEDVGSCDEDPDSVADWLGVNDGLGVGVGDAVCVTLGVGLWVLVWLGLPDELGEPD